MTPDQQKEEVSKAYLAAVAARCGFTFATWSQDQGCIDTTVCSDDPVGAGHLPKVKLDVQLKASSQAGIEHDTHVAWQLDRDHYDKMRRGSAQPHILVILLLPPDPAHWVACTPEQFIIRRCAYWRLMTGEPDVQLKPDGTLPESKTVHLMKANLFGPEALLSIMERVSQGGMP